MYAFGSGSTITATDTAISLLGTGTNEGIYIAGGASAYLTGVSVSTKGNQGAGLIAFSGNAFISAENLAVTTGGTFAYGVEAADNSRIELTGGTVRTSGSDAHGLYAIGSASTMAATGTIVTTSGYGSDGIQILGRGSMELFDVQVNTTGQNGYGATIAGWLEMTGGSLTTEGDNGSGALASGAGTVAAFDHVDITTKGVNSIGVQAQFAAQVSLMGGSVVTAGSEAHGLYSVAASSGAFSSIVGNGVDVRTTGNNAHGILVRGGGHVALTDSRVMAEGENASALASAEFASLLTSAEISRSTLSSIQGSAIAVSNTTLNLTLLDSSISGNGTLARIASRSTLNLDASASMLTGAVSTEVEGFSNLVLRNGTEWVVTGPSNLTSLDNNLSTIRFAVPGDPADAAQYQTLTVGSYTSNGGKLYLNTWLGDDSSPTDRLIADSVVVGNAATHLRVNDTGGLGALTTGNGIQVVRVTNPAASAGGAFVLDGRVAGGAFEYLLFQGGLGHDSDDGNWYLRSTLDGEGPGVDSALPNYRAEVPVAMVTPALASRLALAMLGTYQDRKGPGAASCAGPCNAEPTDAVWARVLGEIAGRGYGGSGVVGRLGDFDAYGPSYDYSLAGFQAGIDLVRREYGEGHRDVAGLYAGYGHLNGSVQGVYGGAAGTSVLDAYSLGAYWTHTGPTGWYVDAVTQLSWYARIDGASVENQSFGTSGFGLTASLEGGYPIALGRGWVIEPQAQLVFQHLSLNSTADAFAQIAYGDIDTVYGRLGVRSIKQWVTDDGRRLSTWIRINAWQNFGARHATTTFSALDGTNPTALLTSIGDTWGQVGLGIVGQLSSNVSLLAAADYSVGLDGSGSSGVSGRFGLQVRF